MRLCYQLMMPVDGTKITLASHLQAMLGSIAVLTVTMVRVQVFSVFVTTEAEAEVSVVIFQVALSWFHFFPKLSVNCSSQSNIINVKIKTDKFVNVKS